MALDDIVRQTRTVRNGLRSLREDHLTVLGHIREEYRDNNNKCVKPKDQEMMRERINNVTQSLKQLEMGIEESSVMVQLSDHFQRLEADRSTLILEMGRVQDENDWLREELALVQQRLQEAHLELADLREEKNRWEFEEELRSNTTESNTRPVTPSKIPVGAWRVEEEKDINRALNGEKRSISPAPSRIPVGGWRARTSAYKNLMEKESKKKSESTGESAKRQYFNINAATQRNGRSKIPSR